MSDFSDINEYCIIKEFLKIVSESVSNRNFTKMHSLKSRTECFIIRDLNPFNIDQNCNFSSKNYKPFFHSIELKYDSICNMPIKGNERHF